LEAGCKVSVISNVAPAVRQVSPQLQLFGFLTTDANAEVSAIHPKAMPVILTSPEAVERWFAVPAPEALALQRPLHDGALRIVATGEKADGVAA
jgi:putative SOS response-associated peptidase YedK